MHSGASGASGAIQVGLLTLVFLGRAGNGAAPVAT